jgi:hypothetical protein
MASTAAVVVGGALANTVGMIIAGKVSHDGSEQKRHDLAMEDYSKAKEKWGEQRINRLEYVNKFMREQRHSQATFTDLDSAGRAYYDSTKHTLPPLQKEPRFSDYYKKSARQQDVEIYSVVGVMAVVGFIAWKFL